MSFSHDNQGLNALETVRISGPTSARILDFFSGNTHELSHYQAYQIPHIKYQIYHRKSLCWQSIP